MYLNLDTQCFSSLIEGIIKSSNEYNDELKLKVPPYHPFLENYPEYENITKVNFGTSLVKSFKYAYLLGAGKYHYTKYPHNMYIRSIP